jgi:phosphate transport system substrate-binding protein
MKRILTALIAIACILAVTCPAGASDLDAFSHLKGTINIAGGTAHIPVMKDCAKNIMQAYPEIRITIAGGGSGIGAQKVGEGLVDIGNTGRALSAKEKAKYDLVSYPFAIDGVCTVLHKDNPVSELSSQQVRDIFAGTISNWKQVERMRPSMCMSGTRPAVPGPCTGKNSLKRVLWWPTPMWFPPTEP